MNILELGKADFRSVLQPDAAMVERAGEDMFGEMEE
jgi:hypothetical protein